MEPESKMKDDLVASVEPVIEIKNLSFAYGGNLVLLEANLSIARGDFVCIVGPNGGGKTTLLRLVLGLLVPDRGSVTGERNYFSMLSTDVFICAAMTITTRPRRPECTKRKTDC